MSWLMGRLLRWLGAFDVTDEMYDGIDAAIEEGGRRLGLEEPVYWCMYPGCGRSDFHAHTR